MSIVNWENLAITVQNFFLSGAPTQTIKVVLNSPINDSINISLTRLSTYQLTLQQATTKVQHFLNSHIKVTNKSVNSMNETYVCATPQSITHSLNKLKSHDFLKYCINNSVSGLYTSLE